MPYINPDWITDEHFEYLDANFDLTKYDTEVDRMINAACIEELVPVPSIPVDIDGYVESIPLQVYGMLLYKEAAFEGYWGKRNGSSDIYHIKLGRLERKIEAARRGINKNTICGATEEETEPAGAYDGIGSRPY